MTPQPNADHALDTYVDSLVAIGGQLTSILQHMYARSSPDDDPQPNAILSDLIRGILDQPNYDLRPADLTAAADVVQVTSRAIAEELFLVSDELMEEWKQEERRARRKLPMRPRRPS